MKEKLDIIQLFIHTDLIVALKADNRLVLVSNPKGNTYIPLFTSQEQYDKWQINQPTQEIHLPQIQRILQTNRDIDGIVINPFDQNLLYEREEIEKATSQPIPFNKNEKVRIGQPKDGQELIECIQTYCQNDANIIEAYVVYMIREINEEASYLVVLQAVDYNEKLCETIASQAVHYLKDTDKLDFISANTDFGQDVIKKSQPIYSKVMN